MRILIYFLILTCGGLAAQTPQDLRSLYGEPDRERFITHSDIALTVEYGPDNVVCGALLVPPATQPLLTERAPDTSKGQTDQIQVYVEGQEPPRYMASNAVTEILEQLAPTASRGEKLRSVMTNSGCNQITITDYANVSIMRSTHNCEPEHRDRDTRASLRYKRNECRSKTLGRYN